MYIEQRKNQQKSKNALSFARTQLGCHVSLLISLANEGGGKGG